MNIMFCENNTSARSSHGKIIHLVSLVEANPRIFLILSRVFSLYKWPNKNEEEEEERNIFLKDLIMSDIQLFEEADELSEELSELLDSFYDSQENMRVSDMRAVFLEEIISKFGPKEVSEPTNDYFEPHIYCNGSLVGNTLHRIDVVFHNQQIHSGEYLECKSNLHNVLSDSLPIRELHPQNRSKLRYIKRVHEFFKNTSYNPFFYIASYTNEVIDYQNNLDRRNYEFIRLLSDQEIYNQIIETVNH